LLVLVVLLPTLGMVGLAASGAASRWSDRGSSVEIRQEAFASNLLVNLRADITDEIFPTAAIVVAQGLGASAAVLARATSIDFTAKMRVARSQVNADPTPRTYPVLAADLARLVALRREVDAGRATPPEVNTVFTRYNADIDRLWQTQLDDIRRLAKASARGGGTLDLSVEMLRATVQAANAGLNRVRIANSVLRGQNTPANVTALIDANSRYATVVADVGGQFGPKAAAAWRVLRADPGTGRVEAVIAQAVTVGLTGAPAPFAADQAAYGTAISNETGWEDHLRILTVAASADLGDLAARQQATTTRAFLINIALSMIAAAVAVATAALAARSITRPLKLLAASAGHITDGRFGLPVLAAQGPRELAETARAVNEMAATLTALETYVVTLADDPGSPTLGQPLPGRTGQALQVTVDRLRDSITAADRQRLELHRLATHDGLTGLLNRTAALEAIARDMSRATRDPRCIAVLFIDLDGLKALNDNCGHRVGDAAIRLTADALQAVTRESDIVARLGGDEFLVSIDGVREPAEIETLAARIRQAVAERAVSAEGKHITLRCSIGIAVARPEDSVESLIHNADQALYLAKQRGRDQAAWYQPGPSSAICRTAQAAALN
jgi:diguanylate cyclase (GGDEF)-like protein